MASYQLRGIYNVRKIPLYPFSENKLFCIKYFLSIFLFFFIQWRPQSDLRPNFIDNA